MDAPMAELSSRGLFNRAIEESSARQLSHRSIYAMKKREYPMAELSSKGTFPMAKSSNRRECISASCTLKSRADFICVLIMCG